MKISSLNTPVNRLALSQGVAYAGRGAAMTALIWVLYESTGSSWWVSGAMLAVFGVSTAVSPWSGHVGDRHDRRVVVLASALFAAFGFAACAVLSELSLTVPIIAVMVLAASTQGALSAAVTGAIPALVAEEDLSGANGVAGAFKSAGFMLGPGVGGALLAVVGPTGVFAASALLLLGAVASVWRLPGTFRAKPHPEHGVGSSLDGYRRLIRDPWLRLLTIAWTIVMIAVGPVIVAEVVLAEQFAVGSIGYGLIAVFWDGGGVIGALVGRRIPRSLERLAIVGGCVAIAFGFAVVGLAPVFWPVLLGMFTAGLFDAFGTVAAQNLIQRRTPDHLRSRVSAALDAVVIGAMSLSFALGAPLVELLGPQGVYLAAAAATLVGAGLLIPTLRGTPVPTFVAGGRAAVTARVRRPERAAPPHAHEPRGGRMRRLGRRSLRRRSER
jgi:MFS family permease